MSRRSVERHRSLAISATAMIVFVADSRAVDVEGAAADSGEKAVGPESKNADTKMGRRVRSS